MGYQLSNGRWSGTQSIQLEGVSGKTVSATEKSNVVEVGGGSVALVLAASNVGASATLDVTVETSRDGATWYTASNGATNAGKFTQVTSTAGTQAQGLYVVVDRYMRLNLALGGTGTVDLVVTGEVSGL